MVAMIVWCGPNAVAPAHNNMRIVEQHVENYSTEHYTHDHIWRRTLYTRLYMAQSVIHTTLYGTEHYTHEHIWRRTLYTRPYMAQSSIHTTIYGTEQYTHRYVWHRALYTPLCMARSNDCASQGLEQRMPGQWSRATS